ncbi:MAG: lytic transglycosylase domain-containing protein [Mesorhizobium sp.]|nr:lytic transglycosylase domain-containing protein [Mesorhizobium sp.]
MTEKQRRNAKTALTSLALAAGMTLPAVAEVVMPDNVPIPRARPYDMSAPPAGVTAFTTGSVVAQSAAAQAANLVVGGDVSRLKSGLDALGSGNAARARSVRDALPANSLDRAILAWAIAVSGDSNVPSTDIAQAARELQGWPGMATLRNNSERALHRENPGPQAVLRAFGDTQPQTVEGAIVLARAHVSVGNLDRARAVLSPIWRNERMEAREEAAILREFGRIIPAADHRHRMERMLYIDRITAAERVAALGGGEALTRAWAAVTRGERNAASLLDAVPQSQRSSGWYFAKGRHLRRNGEKYREAAQVILQAPNDSLAQVDPETWWFERRVLSRELLDVGDAQNAYRVAAAHTGGTPATQVDAAFHAGWYALRALNDASTAYRHFARIVEISEGPISVSRGNYWLGRAAEAGGGGNARQFYERAAQHGTAFYGQLAAAKLGRNTIPADFPSASDTDRRNFQNRQAVHAIRRLEEAGHQTRADTLYRELARQISSPGELALLAVMAERRSHFLALRVGKWAAARGLEVGALAHPVGAIPAAANISMAGKALAYAIARQESEFNIGARSGAGALGILQLLPGTARDMARKIGVSFNQARLTSDAGYNAALGAAYLGEQLETFDGSYILTFVAYNAGPTRARQWVNRYGHPSGQSIEAVVDWIERIPFTETRAYVQRVMENYQVYKMRLSGRMDIMGDLTSGRRR